MQTRRNLMIMGIAFLAAACAEERSAPEQSPKVAEQEQSTPGSVPAAGVTAQMNELCPMAVEGAQVTTSDTDGGIAMTFTTQSGDVDALRQRVSQMAQMYGMHQGQRHMMWRRMGGGMGPGARGGMGPGARGGMGPGARGGMGPGARGGLGPMPAVTTKVDNVDKGASLVLTPNDPAQLDALRTRARMHAQRMQSGQCWMRQR